MRARIKYREIYGELKSRIHDGVYPPGSRIPSQNELMEQFEASFSTISRALQELVMDGYIHRINGKGTFVSERHNKTGKAKTRQIGLVICSLDSRGGMLLGLLLGAFERETRELGYQLVISSSGGDASKEREAIERMCENGVDGIVIWYIGGERNLDVIERLKTTSVPFSLIDRYLPSIPTDYVVTDNYLGGLEAGRFLARMSPARILFFGLNEISTSVYDRTRGFRDAMAEAGLKEASDALFLTVESSQGAYKLALRMLAGMPSPLGIFAINEPVFTEVFKALSEAGRLGSSFLSCFDELYVPVPSSIPFLNVLQPHEQIAAAAVKALDGRIRGGNVSTQLSIPPVFATSGV